MDFKNKDKVILISGGTSGIGLGAAIEFAKRGANVAVCGRHKFKWDYAVCNVIPPKVLTRIEYVPCDVRVESQVENFIQYVFQKYKAVDVFFNNAGVQPLDDGDITKMEFQSFLAPDGSILFRIPPPGKCFPTQKSNISYSCENPVATTCLGIFLCLKYELKCIYAYQSTSRPVSIINTASRMAILPDPKRPLYAASKAFVVALTKSVASFVAQKCRKEGRAMIRINCIAPGATDTPMERDAFHYQKTGWAKYEAKTARNVPLGYIASVKQIVPSILFLADPTMSSYITGSVLVVDGGFTEAPAI